jgi:hypothetical protein
MTSTTRGEILDIIKEVDYNTGFDLMNMLYGLFDGYLYDDLLEVARGAKVDNVLWVYRHFPLRQAHPEAQKMAEAADD